MIYSIPNRNFDSKEIEHEQRKTRSRTNQKIQHAEISLYNRMSEDKKLPNYGISFCEKNDQIYHRAHVKFQRMFLQIIFFRISALNINRVKIFIDIFVSKLQHLGTINFPVMPFLINRLEIERQIHYH